MTDIVDRIKTDEIRWLKLHVLDPEGFLRSLSLSAAILSEQPLKKGFPSEEVAKAFGSEEVVVYPIEDTYSILPWEERGARMLAYLGDKKGGSFPKDPFHAMKRAFEGLEALGHALHMRHRLSFYIFDNINVGRDKRQPPAVGIDSREMPWNPNSRYLERMNAAAVPFDMYSILREQIGDVLNIYFSTPIIENGHAEGPGQQYVKVGMGEGLRSAFDVVNVKFVAKMVSMLNGSFATFMPYPLRGEQPNGWEIELEVWKGRAMDEDATLYFVGGILDHIESLMVFTNPSTNSFKRLKAEPKYGVASPFSSSAVKVGEREGKVTITLTFPDGASNPYLAIAALVGAGMDGIKKKISPEVMEENPASMSGRERAKKGIRELPTSLGEAIKALNSDNSYLKGIFSAELLAIYLEKKVAEERENALTPTHLEWMKYSEL